MASSIVKKAAAVGGQSGLYGKSSNGRTEMRSNTVKSVAAVVAAVGMGVAMAASAGTIANPQNLNLLEWYGANPDFSIGLQTEVSNTAGLSNDRDTMDGGYSVWANVSPGHKIRYAMPEAVTVDQLYLYFGAYGGHPIENFTVRYSDTIDWNDPNWSTSANIYTATGVTTGSHTKDITDADIRYVEVTLDAGCADYNQLGEFQLVPPVGALVNDEGRNLLADPYTNQSYNVGGNVWSTAKVPENSGLLSADGYWQVNFGTPKDFNVVTLSWYPGQGHNNINILTSNDGLNWGSPVWTGNGNTFAEAIFPHVTAQYLRITADYAGGAMNDVHVFYAPIPEPTSLMLLIAGGILLHRRRH